METSFSTTSDSKFNVDSTTGNLGLKLDIKLTVVAECEDLLLSVCYLIIHNHNPLTYCRNAQFTIMFSRRRWALKFFIVLFLQLLGFSKLYIFLDLKSSSNARRKLEKQIYESLKKNQTRE